MASYSGLCVLVKLPAFRNGQQPLPVSLMEVLRDPHILKVGVGCYEDGKRLTRDYGLSMSCTVDLRYLALRQRYSWRFAFDLTGGIFNHSMRVTVQSAWLTTIIIYFLSVSRQAKVNNGLSLKSLAADLLDVCLDKSLELRCSDWEADELTLEQVVILRFTSINKSTI